MEHLSDVKREMTMSSKKPKNYKIFRVEVDPISKDEKKITMKKFYAKDDKEALAELEEYRKIANRQYTYYYGSVGQCACKDKNGKTVYFDDMKEMHEAWKKEHETILEKLSFAFDIYIKCPLNDFFYNRRCKKFFKKTGHRLDESYALDSHIINDLLFNIPRIIKSKNGCLNEYIIKALQRKHKDEKDFDAWKHLNEHPDSDNDVIWKEAREMYEKDLEKILLNARLYQYYISFGIIDERNVDEVELDKKWHKTLPYVPGKYKELDYTKLNSLAQNCWNAIWNDWKKIGQMMWA